MHVEVNGTNCDGTPLLVGALRTEIGEADLGGQKGAIESEAFRRRQKNRLEIARILLKAGAPLDSSDSNGWTPLHAVMTFPAIHPALVQLVVNELVFSGVSTEATDRKGMTPMQLGSVWPPYRAGLLKEALNRKARDGSVKPRPH